MSVKWQQFHSERGCCAGTVIVGLQFFVGVQTKNAGASNPALGNAIIVLAQIVVGVQMCWEEKYVSARCATAPPGFHAFSIFLRSAGRERG